MAAPDHHIGSVATAFRVIETLDHNGAMGVTEIARETGINKSSVYKHLDTLRHQGYVTKDDDGYVLSLRWFGAGRRVRDRDPVVRGARGELDELADRTGETVSLVVEEEGDAVYLYQVSGGDAAAPVEAGGRIPAPISVGGKAVLSFRPTDEVEALLAEHELDAEADRLFAELEAVRDQRMVIERDSPAEDVFSAGAFVGHRHVVGHDEPYRNIHSVAVPVRDADNYAVAAIEVSGAEASLYGRRLEEEIAELLVSTGKAIETELIQRVS